MDISTKPRKGILIALVVGSLPLTGLIGLNLFLAFGLPTVVNEQPDKVRFAYDAAWMIVPGRLHVRGLRIDGTGPRDAWTVTADAVAGTVDPWALRRRTFAASALSGRGVTFTYTRDEDAPAREPGDRQWSVSLTGVALEEVREVVYGDYHLRGDARVRDGALSLDGPSLDAAGSLVIEGMDLGRGDDTLAQGLRGALTVELDDVEREAGLGREIFRALSGSATLEADVKHLKFMSYYLVNAPWLTLRGAGRVDVDLTMAAGHMLPGSQLTVEVPSMEVGFLGWVIAGDCLVRLDVVDEPTAPGSRLSVDFDAFSITAAGGHAALLEGEGFQVTATTPDVHLAEPFTTLDVVLELPRSRIADFGPYHDLLPSSLDLGIGGGRGTARGRVQVSAVDALASGDLWVDGQDVRAQIGDVTISADFAVHGKLTDGRIADGTYDISGSSAELTGVTIRTSDPTDDGSAGWSASLSIPSGEVRVGSPVHFDADLALQCRDTAPFLTMFEDRRSLPGWARQLMTVRDVRGVGHVTLGDAYLSVDSIAIGGDTYELLLHMRRQGARNRGALFARMGMFSIGYAVDGEDKRLRVFGAREWYAEEAAKARRRD